MKVHAPLPWSYTLDGTGQPDSVKKMPGTGEVYQEPAFVVDANGRAVARLRCHRPGEDFREDLAQRHANAELIVCAVNSRDDLVLALEQVLSMSAWVIQGIHSMSQPPKVEEEAARIFGAARAALTRAHQARARRIKREHDEHARMKTLLVRIRRWLRMEKEPDGRVARLEQIQEEVEQVLAAVEKEG